MIRLHRLICLCKAHVKRRFLTFCLLYISWILLGFPWKRDGDLWAISWQNQNGSVPSKDRLAWASAVWSESPLSAQCVHKDPRFLHVESEDQSDWAATQADLSFRQAHKADPSLRWAKLLCWFCHTTAHIIWWIVNFPVLKVSVTTKVPMLRSYGILSTGLR